MVKVKSSTTTGTLQQPGDFVDTKKSEDILNQLLIPEIGKNSIAIDSQGLISNSIKTDNLLETVVTRNGESKTPYQDIHDLEKHMAAKQQEKVSNGGETGSQLTLSITKVQPTGRFSMTGEGSLQSHTSSNEK